jgi:hypothetical protein
MNSFYELIGRAAVRIVIARYRKQIRAAFAIGVIGIVVGGYIALTRDVAEG